MTHFPIGVGGDAGDPEFSAAKLDEEKDVETIKQHRIDGKKSVATICDAWIRRTSRQVGPLRLRTGSRPWSLMIQAMVLAARRTPILISSCCAFRLPGLHVDGQRSDLHGRSPSRTLRDGKRDGFVRDRVQALAALPSPSGKVERFHQTLKKYLAKQKRAGSIEELQAQLDTFAEYYNNVRPHRAIGRRTPAQTYAARTKATPAREGFKVPAHYRVRRDRVDNAGKVTLRYRSKLLHIGVGRAYIGDRILLLVPDRHVRIVSDEGVLIHELTIDPKRIYQPQPRP